MTSGARLPTWKERENNKKRERRRRAIAAKIFAGLRLYGNYKLPKHCDNNEVLKALCAEAGWVVEEDGSTYRKGSKPPERGDAAPMTACFQVGACENGSLIPWLKGLNGLHMNIPREGNCSSAPVTPPLSSPTARIPYVKPEWDAVVQGSDNGLVECNDTPSSVSFPLGSSWPFHVGDPAALGGRFEFPANFSAGGGGADRMSVGCCGGEEMMGRVMRRPGSSRAGERPFDLSPDDLELTLGSSSLRSSTVVSRMDPAA